MWSWTRLSKGIKIFWAVHSRSFLRYQCRNFGLFWIWCCFQFFLHCLVQPNQVIHFLFHKIFILSIRLKQSTCTLYASEISLIKVFINTFELAGEMPIDWNFFVGVWHSVNSLSVSVTDWTLSWSSIHLVCL